MAKKTQNSNSPSGARTQSLDILPGGKLNNFLNNFPDRVKTFRASKTFYILLIALGLALLFFFKKSWFIAAMVNGSPITNLELQSKLNQQFKSQTLNQLINEKIISNEATKNNVIVSETDINNKIREIEVSVGGVETLNSLLSQQGQTRDTIRQQIKLQLTIDKLYSKEATVSAEEVAKFIEQNKQSLSQGDKQSLPSGDDKNQLSASESAKLEKEATDAIKNQKITQIFSEKFQELRQKAKIQTF